MLVLLLTTLATAEQTEEASLPSLSPVLYSGNDGEASLIRTSKASDLGIEQLELNTIVDLTGSIQPKLIGVKGEEQRTEVLKACSGNAITNKHIQNYTQTAFNNYSYYELEKSAAALNKAETSLVCLQELFNGEDVRSMYYLKGILEQSKGNNAESKQAFSSAIRIKPDLQWNDMFAPDAKSIFDSAKEEFSSLTSVPLNLIPQSAASSLWINGTPLLDVDNPSIYAGTNIIQLVGLETTTYEITVPEDVDSVRLILPSTLPNTAYTWAGDENKSSELSEVLSLVISEGSSVYVHDSGQVWTSDLSQSSWTELEVPKFAETRLNAKKITGQTLFWTGLATSAVSLGFGTNYYIQGQQTYQASADTQDWNEFTGYSRHLGKLETRYQASVLTLGIGLGLTGFGYVLAF